MAFKNEFQKIVAKYVGPGKKFRNNRDLADSAGITDPVISAYTTGRTTNPKPDVLTKISKALGYSDDYLIKLWLSCQEGSTTPPPDSIKEQPPTWNNNDKVRFEALFKKFILLDEDAKKYIESRMDGFIKADQENPPPSAN